MKKLLSTALCLLSFMLYADTVNVVPKPVSVSASKGVFLLSKNTIITYSGGAKQPATLFQSYLKSDSGELLKVAPGKNGNICFELLKSQNMADEAYTINITPKRITVAAAKLAGLRNGAATLRQLIPPRSKFPVKIQCVKISDQPSYSYRAMMLDCGRHYYSVPFIKRFIDILALHKLNVFHWHLVEDAGWRPEIKGYPKLITKGAYRKFKGKKIGGYYSIKDMKLIVKYAADRNITVIPEIEVPAHTLAALVAYPELGCVGRGYKMPNKQFISKDILCPGKETTWKFLRAVFDEICDIFPGVYIHVGGDEAKYDHWKKCKKCQALMKKEGLKNEKQLQGWMVKKIEQLVAGKGKKLIGWDEILRCGVSKNTAIMVWNRKKAAAEGAKQGHKVVVALTSNCYFDTPESKLAGEPPAATWIPPISLKKAYTWDPMPSGLSSTQQRNILGVEGCIWSDQILNHPKLQPKEVSEKYVEYLLLPRVASLAEVSWTPKQLRNWADFSSRMNSMFMRYDQKGYNFRIPVPAVKVSSVGGKSVISAVPGVSWGKLKYEIGSKNPTAKSKTLSGELTVSHNKRVRISTYLPVSGRLSIPCTVNGK